MILICCGAKGSVHSFGNDSMLHQVDSSARDAKGEEILTQSIKARVALVAVAHNHDLCHQLGNSQIPHILFTGFSKDSRAFLRKLRDLLRETKEVVTQPLALGIRKWECRVRVGTSGRTHLGWGHHAELFWLQLHGFNKEQIALVAVRLHLAMATLPRSPATGASRSSCTHSWADTTPAPCCGTGSARALWRRASC